jgi:uncharacterized protein (DUF924 family)
MTGSVDETCRDIVEFWMIEAGPSRWYQVDDAFDQRIRDTYQPLWRSAWQGKFGNWMASAEGALALLLLCDQFPRNMFRGQAIAFASDPRARELAREAIASGFDQEVAPDARQFFYLPFEHSEDMEDQLRAVELFTERLPGEGLTHARAHAATIAEFGRFPWRNAALGRVSTREEEALLAAGGYAEMLRRIR